MSMIIARQFTCAEMKEQVGEELGVSDWLLVTQDLIDKFSESTRDPDWIHVDPERAARETPFGGTIAFGFWTLSMLTHFSHQIGMWPKEVEYALNYGLDRVRWVAPVPVGALIRNRCRLISFEERDPGRFMIRTANTLELEGSERPALVAEWIGLFLTEGAEPAASSAVADAYNL
jgi:acyl dehydratase